MQPKHTTSTASECVLCGEPFRSLAVHIKHCPHQVADPQHRVALQLAAALGIEPAGPVRAVLASLRQLDVAKLRELWREARRQELAGETAAHDVRRWVTMALLERLPRAEVIAFEDRERARIRYRFRGRLYRAADLARGLAAAGLPVSPADLDAPELADVLADEMRDLGHEIERVY